jgi:ferric-dicitrate binding protein FerR (iron transport regulator)
VSRVIPAVSIMRGAKSMTASPKTAVDWQDSVNTQANARARIALDDGSVLNVGADSSLKVVKHDAGAQQTELELAYGKLRTQAQKIAKSDGKFEVRTPAGVAGVVGTDFYAAYDATTNTMNVIVFEGLVKVCNLAGVCVIVKPGQMTNVRNGDNSGPLPPVQAPLDLLVAAGKDSDVGRAWIAHRDFDRDTRWRGGRLCDSRQAVNAAAGHRQGWLPDESKRLLIHARQRKS